MPRPTPSQLLVTFYFWAVFAVTLPVGLLLGAFVLLLTWPFDPDRRWVLRFGRLWTFDYLRVNPLWRIQIQGQERLPLGAFILVANHPSPVDAAVLMGLGRSFKLASKGSPSLLPFVGRSMLVPFERCRDWISRGGRVLIFPESAESPTGELLSFSRAAFSLALESQVPLVPVAIFGTSRLLPNGGRWLSARCDIRMAVLEPLSPSDFGPDAEGLAEKVRVRLAAELTKAAGSA